MVPYTKSLALYPNGYQRVFATVADCQGTSNDTTPNVKDPALKQALQSFPSGHAGIAFAVGVFLSLYLNAKLKAFADYHTSLWKVVVVLLPLVSAALIAGGLMIDHVSLACTLSLLHTDRFLFVTGRTTTPPTFSPAYFSAPPSLSPPTARTTHPCSPTTPTTFPFRTLLQGNLSTTSITNRFQTLR